MKKITALLLAVMMLVTSYTIVLADEVQNDLYGTYVLDMAKKGIINGYPGGDYGLNDTCTRAQFITFLYRAQGSPAVVNEVPFTDVVKGEYYADAIAWGYENGIIQSYEDNTIGVNLPVDREHAAVFLYEWAKLQGKADNKYGAAISEYSDAQDIYMFSRTAFAWAVKKGLIKAENGLLSPKAAVTRGWTVYAIGDILNRHVCDWADWKDNGDGTHTRSCTLEGCGVTDTGAHEFNDGELTVAPTQNSDGEITYTCTKCLFSEKEIAPKGTEIVTREDIEKAVVEAGWAYYATNPHIQYDSSNVSFLSGYVGGTRRATAETPPEYATEDTTFYSVCSDFLHQSFVEGVNESVMGDNTAPFGLSTINYFYSAENQQQLPTAQSSIYEPMTDEDVDVCLLRWMDFDYAMEKVSVENFAAYGVFESEYFDNFSDEIEFRRDGTDGNEHYSYYDKAGNKLDAHEVLKKYVLAFTDEWEKNLRPGDVLLTNSHTMMNAGGNTLLHCSYSTGGGKITKGVDKIEPDGAIFAQYDYARKTITSDTKRASFVITRPINMLVSVGYDNDPGNDIAKPDVKVAENTKVRAQYPIMNIDRTVDITPYGTATVGQTLTYTIKIANKTNDENYLKWGEGYDHGQRKAQPYENLVVTETVPAGCELVESSVNGGKVEDSKITWNIATIAPGKTAEISYSVKVTGEVGSLIVNDGGSVCGIPSNSIKNVIGGAKLDDAQASALSQISAGGIEGLAAYGTDTAFAEEIYKKIGSELDLPEVKDIVANLFGATTIIPGYGRGKNGGMYGSDFNPINMFLEQTTYPEEYNRIRSMLVRNVWGGTRFQVREENKWNFAEKVILDYKAEFLEKGDIIIHVTGTDVKNGPVTNDLTKVTVMVYDGENLLKSANEETITYEIIGKDDVYKTLTGLISSADKELFFTLRPSQYVK